MLTGFMMLFLWMLQISFIGPYYERNRFQLIQSTVTEINRQLAKGDFSAAEKSISKTLTQENMCGVIYNNQGYRVLLAAENGNNCHITNLSSSAVTEYISMVNNSATNDFSIRFNSEIFEQGMYFYGKMITVDDFDYYVFINTPIELLDSTVYVLKRQFGLVGLVVFSVATLVAFVLSRRLSQPITKITKQAERLARGDLDVSFDEREYTEVETLSSALNYATDEFRKTDELRRDLVANVSHDIKTPLTMIKAYAEMIEDISGDDKDMREKHLGIIVDEANHLERLVNDMLTLSKYESKVFDVKVTRYQLKDQVDSTFSLFQVLDINFINDVDESIMVEADEIKMGQVLYNFVNNATRYVGNDKTIRVTARILKNTHEVEISVIDKGPGISPEIIGNIWDRYYKIDKNYSRSGSNSGLGLSIVRAICEATGSKYGVDSELGKGSRFYYTLRLSEEDSKNRKGKKEKSGTIRKDSI